MKAFIAWTHFSIANIPSVGTNGVGAKVGRECLTMHHVPANEETSNRYPEIYKFDKYRRGAVRNIWKTCGNAMDKRKTVWASNLQIAPLTSKGWPNERAKSHQYLGDPNPHKRPLTRSMGPPIALATNRSFSNSRL